jgi:DNA primase
VRLIKKFTENITIMYDGDSAGIHAALRGIPMVLAEGMNVHVVLLPDGDDPDSFSRKHSRDEVREYIAQNEKDFIVFKTDLLLSQAAGDPLRKAGLINGIADTIAHIPDAVKRTTYAEAVARQFDMEVGNLLDRIGRNFQDSLASQEEKCLTSEICPILEICLTSETFPPSALIA